MEVMEAGSWKVLLGSGGGKPVHWGCPQGLGYRLGLWDCKGGDSIKRSRSKFGESDAAG